MCSIVDFAAYTLYNRCCVAGTPAKRKKRISFIGELAAAAATVEKITGAPGCLQKRSGALFFYVFRTRPQKTEKKEQGVFEKVSSYTENVRVAARNTDFLTNSVNIIEQGTHRELLEKGGAYAALYNSQFA